MASAVTNNLLSLPQELRDLIYLHTFDETLTWPETFKDYQESPTSCMCIGDHEEAFRCIFPSKSPQPAWLSLLYCCKTTNRDIQNLINNLNRHLGLLASPTVDLFITTSTATSTWLHLPYPPSQIQTLQINIHIQHLWDQSITSGTPSTDNKILKSLFVFLKNFCTHGPHLSRPSRLAKPLSLAAVTLNLQPAFDAEEASFFCGNPQQQFATVCGVFNLWLERLVQSGLLTGNVERLKWKSKGVVEFGTLIDLVTDKVEEGDYLMMRSLGYRWD